MNSLLLCIILPTIVVCINNSKNVNISSHRGDIAHNPNIKSLLKQVHLNKSTIKYTKPVAKKVTNTKNHAKPKSKNEKKIKQVPRVLKIEHRPVKSVKFVKPVRPVKPVKPVKSVKPVPRDLPDMPVESDLEEIMDSIIKALDFFLENKNDVDISLNYGLFIMSVNLQTVFQNKRNTLPPGISFNLKQILEKNDQLLKFFKAMVERDDDPDDDLSKSLTNLFNHERLWMSRIEKFDGHRVNETAEEQFDILEYRYSYWEKYLDKVGDFNKAIPRPDQSNRCLSYLANNHASRDSWKKECNIPIPCKKPLANGSEYGYGLTHRLLYLQLAYYGYRCHVFSNEQDKNMREQFCKKMFAEATYISYNSFGVIDLFVEQLCLCALDGHFQFLQRSWLLTIISFQTDAGCFSVQPVEKRPHRPPYDEALRHKWQLDKGENQYILGGYCNVHMSSASVATLGFGVKFILETYY